MPAANRLLVWAGGGMAAVVALGFAVGLDATARIDPVYRYGPPSTSTRLPMAVIDPVTSDTPRTVAAVVSDWQPIAPDGVATIVPPSSAEAMPLPVPDIERSEPVAAVTVHRMRRTTPDEAPDAPALPAVDDAPLPDTAPDVGPEAPQPSA